MRHKVRVLDSKPDGVLKKLQMMEGRLKKLQETKEPFRRSQRLFFRTFSRLRRESNKQKTHPQRKKAFNWNNATSEEFAEKVLCDYNRKHGTKLEFVGLLVGKDNCFFDRNYFTDFEMEAGMWYHLNFEARRGGGDADPSDKPLVLFAELMRQKSKCHLITLSLVKPTDESNGCPHCSKSVSHPLHGFRAGLFREPNVLSEPEMWPEQAAAQLSEFALQGYNKKHGTTIKFERALKCHGFTGCGLSLDFTEKKTKWVHMNFEVRVDVGRHESVVCLFAELYLGDDGEFVLATLSPAEPLEIEASTEEWRKFYGGVREWRKEDYVGVKGCVFCPADILHPKACRFAKDESERLEEVLPKQT